MLFDKVLHLSVMSCMPSDGQRRYDMARLYTFPDDVRNEFVNYYSNKEIVDYF